MPLRKKKNTRIRNIGIMLVIAIIIILMIIYFEPIQNITEIVLA